MQLTYTNQEFDRCSEQRKSESWIAEQLNDLTTRYILFWQGKPLISLPELDLHYSDHKFIEQLASHYPTKPYFLGCLDGRAIFAIEIDTDNESIKGAVAPGKFIDLRSVVGQLDSGQSTLVAFGLSLINWHRNHKYCGACGSLKESKQGGHVLVCSNSACNKETFPRTDPAVIMLVIDEDKDRCLLGNGSRFPENMFSTLAGFVEPAESLEQTVVREVKEEVGITVSDPQYLGSQPWPFPSSLMIGYLVKAETFEIKIDPSELNAAHWFTREEISQAGEWGDDDSLCLPRKDSIARYLIDYWMKNVS